MLPAVRQALPLAATAFRTDYYAWVSIGRKRIYFRSYLLNVSKRLHAQTGRHLVVGQENQVRNGRLGKLAQEVARAGGGDGHHRRLRRRDAACNSRQDVAYSLRR